MNIIDFAIMAIYFIIIFTIGFKSSRQSLKDSTSYFLGGHSIGWLAIGASLFASNISAEHFIGLAGTGSSSGLAVGQFEWLACLILLLLGWFFVPFYMRSGVFTMPEFLEKRFSSSCRTYLSSISLIAYVFTKISVAIYAGAIVLETILGWNIWVGAIVLIAATGVYTMFGGLRAVIYTDLFQAGVLIIGGAFLTFNAIHQVGGLSEVLNQTESHFFNIWKSFNHPEFPWTGILFGAPILGIWYWCTDQFIVQRTLAARNIEAARRATILAGFLKILPVFILVLPGIAGRILFPETAPDKMYATMVNNLLPTGIKGIVVAGLLAALMSSLSSIFNSSSTLVVMDFYKKFRPDANEKELVRAGQVSTIGLIIIGLIWLPFIGLMSDQLYVYLQSVQAYISPPIAAVFLIGLLWKGANSKGAMSALLGGFVLGSLRFVSEIGVKIGWIKSPFLTSYAAINFLHFAILLFVISVFLLVSISLITKEPAKSLAGLSQGQEIPQNKKDHNLNVILTFCLIGIVLLLWGFFSSIFFG